MFWIKIVGSTYGDYSWQTVELILWKGFRSKKTLSSKTLIYKYWNCIPHLRLNIVKENHTLFCVQTHLGQIRPGSTPHAPGSASKLWKESGIWSFHIILDESGKIDSSVNVVFRVTFHVWTVTIYRRVKECLHNLNARRKTFYFVFMTSGFLSFHVAKHVAKQVYSCCALERKKLFLTKWKSFFKST